MLSERMKRQKDLYLNTMPGICVERAKAFTKSHRETEGKPLVIRRALAFKQVCETMPVEIFPDELIVGTPGLFRRSGFICPEFSWKWVDEEMDGFENRTQDPYAIGSEEKRILREEIFPYWRGRSLEETFLARLPRETFKLAVDTGIIDNDNKWRSAVGEITPDYQDILFKKGFDGIRQEALDRLEALEPVTAEDQSRMEFYEAAVVSAEAIATLARRYAEKAEASASREEDPGRRAELAEIAKICRKVPGRPPETFAEAIQMVWFVQLGEILSENSLALNLGRFDQYMHPFYERDLAEGRLTEPEALELVESLWLKLSEWVWAISRNTAQYYAGYNAFQNLTLGGRRRDGRDATNALSYLCLKATKELKTHQPGLSVRIHPDTPSRFMMAVCDLIREGTGFPAVHNDRVGSAMLMAAGLSPEDARDWSNCGCVVPHFRKNGEWTAAVNINLAAPLEYAMTNGKSRQTGESMGMETGLEFESFEAFKQAYFKQLSNLVKHAVISTVTAQRIHAELVPRPFISLLVDGCMQTGRDLSRGGAHYNVGPVLTGIGVADAANGLMALRELVFERKSLSLSEFNRVLESDWEGHEALLRKALSCPKYGNDMPAVDALAIEITDFYNREIKQYVDCFGVPFNSAFMGISNYVPTGTVIGATPEGRKSGAPLTEGVSPHAGTDVTSPTAAMRSAAAINHDVHSGGTLLNLKMSPELLKGNEGLRTLAALIRGYFDLGAFHVQFNVISTELLRKAQENPEEHKDLLVRVAGYSTQFVNLSREMQDAIIERTTYEAF